MSKKTVFSIDSFVLWEEISKFLLGSGRLVIITLSPGVSGTAQHTERQFPDSQQLRAEETGCIGIVSQPWFSMSVPATAKFGAETSVITAETNDINTSRFIFIVLLSIVK